MTTRKRTRKPKAEPPPRVPVPVRVKISTVTGRGVLHDFSGRVADLRAVAAIVNEANEYRRALQGLVSLHMMIVGRLPQESEGYYRRRVDALRVARGLLEGGPKTCSQ